MLIPQASNTASNVDAVFYRILWIELALLVIVTFAMVFFVVKYNSRKKTVPENISGSMLLEIIWTVIPTLIVFVMFYIGVVSFDSIRAVPKTVMDIRVTGRQWSWLFTYENGRQSSDLRVPVGKAVKLLLTSDDVLHSFYIPAFRIKEDCVPKMETYLSFTPDEIGTYDIFCTEFCGLGHSGMVSKVIVMQQQGFRFMVRCCPCSIKNRREKRSLRKKAVSDATQQTGLQRKSDRPSRDCMTRR